MSVYNLWILYVAKKNNHTESQNLLDKERATNICFLVLWSVLPWPDGVKITQHNFCLHKSVYFSLKEILYFYKQDRTENYFRHLNCVCSERFASKEPVDIGLSPEFSWNQTLQCLSLSSWNETLQTIWSVLP